MSASVRWASAVPGDVHLAVMRVPSFGKDLADNELSAKVPIPEARLLALHGLVAEDVHRPSAQWARSARSVLRAASARPGAISTAWSSWRRQGRDLGPPQEVPKAIHPSSLPAVPPGVARLGPWQPRGAQPSSPGSGGLATCVDFPRTHRALALCPFASSSPVNQWRCARGR